MTTSLIGVSFPLRHKSLGMFIPFMRVSIANTESYILVVLNGTFDYSREFT